MGHIGSRAKEGDLVVLAFAGYGIHLHGADYLVPGDADVAALKLLFVHHDAEAAAIAFAN